MQSALLKAHTIEESVEAVLFPCARSNQRLCPEALNRRLCRTVCYSGCLEARRPQAVFSGCIQYCWLFWGNL